MSAQAIDAKKFTVHSEERKITALTPEAKSVLIVAEMRGLLGKGVTRDEMDFLFPPAVNVLDVFSKLKANGVISQN